MVVADVRQEHLLPALALCCYISVVLILMIARYHQNLTIVLRSPLPESEMRNGGVNKIPDVSSNDKHIADRFQRQRPDEAHILMKLHVQVRAILNFHFYISSNVNSRGSMSYFIRRHDLMRSTFSMNSLWS